MTDHMTDNQTQDRTTDEVTDRTTNDDQQTNGTADRTETTPSSAESHSPACPALWVGFLELEEWLGAVDPSRPVLLLPVAEPSFVDGPFHAEDLLVSCQQVTASGQVLYCRLRADSLTRVSGVVLDPDRRERAASWESLWGCVEGIVEERGLCIVSAAVSRPSGQVLLWGQSRGVCYDERDRRFRRTPAPCPASAA